MQRIFKIGLPGKDAIRIYRTGSEAAALLMRSLMRAKQLHQAGGQLGRDEVEMVANNSSLTGQKRPYCRNGGGELEKLSRSKSHTHKSNLGTFAKALAKFPVLIPEGDTQTCDPGTRSTTMPVKPLPDPTRSTHDLSL